MSEADSDNSLPHLPDNDSVGSSVSSSLQKEYEELLKYAVVTPKINFPEPVYQFERDSLKGTTSLSEVSTNASKVTSSSSQSTYSEDISTVARDDVKQLPGTPMISFHGQGSVARDSLLREGTATTPNDKVDSPVKSDESPSSERTDDSPRSEQTSPAIDGDLARMEGLLDSWCLDLKRNVLAEMAQSKMALYEKQKQTIILERRRHTTEMNKLLNEFEGMKELLVTFEQTIERKDAIITNLTSAMQKQKDKSEMLKRFCSWKVKHSEQKSESFGGNLARKHYRQTLRMKAWNGWRSVIESKWKDRVEKACQSKAQEVCIKLTGDYEQKLETANRELEEARAEIAKLHAQRDMYEETMKKAFMRGVCALNLEAMTMFGKDADDDGNTQGTAPIRQTFQDDEEKPRGQVPRPTVTTSGGVQFPINTHRSVPAQRHPPPPGSSGMQRHHTAGRTVTVKAVGRSDLQGEKPVSGAVGTQGPVTSILVERHDPQSGAASIGHVRKDPSKERYTSSRATSTRVTRPGVQTVHTTPLKVVH